MDTKQENGSLDKIIAVISKQLGKKPEDIKPEKRIVEDLGADSLDVVEMLMTLEETYGVAIPDDDAMQLRTVNDLVAYLDKHLKQG